MDTKDEAAMWSAVRRLVPELSEELRWRTRILERIYALGPIGRRALALEMGTTERILRANLDFLREQGLLVASAAGVSLSEDGERALEMVGEFASKLDGRAEQAETVSRLLRIPTVIVVEGDSDEVGFAKDNLGYRAAEFLKRALTPLDILAVTGGTTMASVARRMSVAAPAVTIKVVPARGGLGETVEIQANSIASKLAEKLGGHSVMLHVPDRLGEEALDQLLADPYVEQRLQEIRQATVVLHGIGSALEMAERRQASQSELKLLEENCAVAEAFGYYFNASGDVVYAMPTVGLRLTDLPQLRIVMAVAGGGRKADAVAAAAKAYRIDVLVTDEGAAKRMIEKELDKRREIE
ncbi:MAG: DNA-binding transcriptional regulator [Alicyclobacillaceae bacterium]|nr:DNA-binding transcriptional regulator [Alicyclobacillaceae bacterium]